MSILNVEHLTHGFGDKAIFNDVSFRLLKGEHIGLVGANGEGKSTFFNIVTGKLMPDEGKIEWAKNVRVGYLDQHSVLSQGMSIRDVLKSAFSYLFEMEERMNGICDSLGTASPEEMDTLMEELGTIQDTLTMHDFYVIDAKVEEVARALGLLDIGLERDVTDLSGGQRTKVLLGKLLLEKPDILLLDEPTNYLDEEHIEWLKRYLQDYENAFILISHDIPFLNSVINLVYHMENQELNRYVGDYDHFQEVYEVKKAQLEAAYRRQQQEISELKDFVARNKARVSTRNMAMSRQKNPGGAPPQNAAGAAACRDSAAIAGKASFPLLKIFYENHCAAQHGQHHARDAIERFCVGTVGEQRGHTRAQQCGRGAYGEREQVRQAADGHVGHGAGERGEGHDEHAGADCRFQLIAQHAGEDEQQHHTAASADEAADKADEHAAQHGLHGFCAGAFVRVGPFGRHHGTHDEFNAQQQRHHNRETAHGAVGHQRGRPASHHCEHEHRAQHDEPVFDVQIFVFAVGVGGHRRGQHVGRKRDADGLIGGEAQERDEHGGDDSRGRKPGQPGADAGAQAGKDINEDVKRHIDLPPGHFAAFYPAPCAAPRILRRLRPRAAGRKTPAARPARPVRPAGRPL